MNGSVESEEKIALAEAANERGRSRRRAWGPGHDLVRGNDTAPAQAPSGRRSMLLAMPRLFSLKKTQQQRTVPACVCAPPASLERSFAYLRVGLSRRELERGKETSGEL